MSLARESLVFLPLALPASTRSGPRRPVSQAAHTNASRGHSLQTHAGVQGNPCAVPKSWDFLTEYVLNTQKRSDRMKSRLVESKKIALDLEAAALAQAKDAEAKAAALAAQELRQRLEREQKKLEAASDYERPQATAQAVKFEAAAQEQFARSKTFEAATDSASKAFRMEMKMTVNRKVGQLTDSRKQIEKVLSDLLQLYYQARTRSKEAAAYCLILIASKIITQAETQVSLHAPSAFPLAQLAVELGTSVVEVPAVLITILFRKCCFAVPRYPAKTGTEEQFKRDCGYNQLNGKIAEADSAFAERMSGLIGLFAALIQTSSFSGKPNVLGLPLGWSWLAAILNMTPRMITPLLLVSFLEQAAFGLYKHYGANFEMLVRFVADKYIPMVPKAAVASKTRLELFSAELLKSGAARIKEPTGRRFTP